jgi:hypothetical protein
MDSEPFNINVVKATIKPENIWFGGRVIGLKNLEMKSLSETKESQTQPAVHNLRFSQQWC